MAKTFARCRGLTQGNGFDPNQSTSIEAGLKFALLDGSLDATISLFRVEQENILVVDDPSAFTYAAAGEAESQGFELDVAGRFANDVRYGHRLPTWMLRLQTTFSTPTLDARLVRRQIAQHSKVISQYPGCQRPSIRGFTAAIRCRAAPCR